MYNYDYRGHRKGYLFWYWCTGIYLVCIAGFRWRLGGDTYFYMNWFDIVPTIDNLTIVFFALQRYEPLFVILASICKTIYPEFWLLQFVQASIVTSVVFWFINRETKHIFSGVAFYFFILFFGFMYDIMRESLAISCFILAWPYLMRSKWIIYYPLIFIAFLFHSGALVLFLLPLLKYKSWKFLRWNSLTPIYLFFILLGGFIIRESMFHVLFLLPLPETLAARVLAFSTNPEGGNTLNIFGMLTTLLNKALYPIMAIYLYQKAHKKSLIIDIEPMVMLLIIFTILQLPIMILRRFGNYFYIFSIILMARFAFNKILVSTRRFKFFTWLILFSIIPFLELVYWSRIDSSSGIRKSVQIYPYTHIFTKEVVPERENFWNYYDLHRQE